MRNPKTVARHALDAALSQGAGYERQPIGRHRRPGHVLGYQVDLTAKTSSSVLLDGVGPADLAQLALGWWERSLDGHETAIGHFEDLAHRLELMAETAADGLRWPYTVDVPKYRLRAPWYSAMAQGQVASVFVRAYATNRVERYRDIALAAIAPLLVEEPNDLVSFTDEGPVLEEAPSNPRSHILNGWIYALWGVWDVAVGLDSDGAHRRFTESTEALAAKLDSYDLGWWTRYSLYPHAAKDLAKPFYHEIHATQAGVMHELTGLDVFGDAATRWRHYNTTRNRMRAIGQKAYFVGRVRLFDR
jgi:hypothetical protein